MPSTEFMWQLPDVVPDNVGLVSPTYNGEWSGDFVKMECSGNDFIIIDGRLYGVPVLSELVHRLCDRHYGIGCDQLIVLEKAEQASHVRMRMFNANGSEAESCGNASCCVGLLLRDEMENGVLTIETVGGELEVEACEGNTMRVDLGMPRLNWRDIPLAKPMDVMHVSLGDGILADGCAVNVGNPHVVFMCDSVPSDDQVRAWGKQCEHHPLFPERVNVSFVHPQDDGALRLRVWERGAGMTRACGTAAGASVVAAHLRQKIDRCANIIMDGGMTRGAWLADDHVTIEGTGHFLFSGSWQQYES